MYSCSQKGVALVHEGNKSFKSEVCDYNWFQKGPLKQHVERVHDGNKTLKFEVGDHRSSQKG